MMEKAQKFSVTYNSKTYNLKGELANGKPVGEVEVTVDDTTTIVSFPAGEADGPVAAAVEE